MAYIHYRKAHEASVKKSGKWVPRNRKYKWMFYTLLTLNLALITPAIIFFLRTYNIH